MKQYVGRGAHHTIFAKGPLVSSYATGQQIQPIQATALPYVIEHLTHFNGFIKCDEMLHLDLQDTVSKRRYETTLGPAVVFNRGYAKTP
jgi:hypothetical protein